MRCIACSVEKPSDDFRDNPNVVGGKSAVCKACFPETSRPPAAARKSAGGGRQVKSPALDLKPTRDLERHSSRPPVLVINTYAGSLLLAAKQLGLDVAGAYEDCGFGQQWAARNFPEHEGLFASRRESWPEHRLDETIIIAHPPCAAFSNLSKGVVNKPGGKGFGLKSPHFEQTRDVMRYAMRLNAPALALESVPGAHEGAREEHDTIAAEFGYKVFRVLQNAATFGVPQWRSRFWLILLRPDVAQRMAFHHVPQVAPIGLVLDPDDAGPTDPTDDELLEGQRWLLKTNGLSDAEVEAALTTPGMLLTNVANLRPELDGKSTDMSAKWCVGMEEHARAYRVVHRNAEGAITKVDGDRFISTTARILDPLGTSAVILATSWFIYRGRSVTPREYRRIMGFPADYELDHNFRLWLSKGVVPNVAAWILDQVLNTVEGKTSSLPDRGVAWCEPGDTVDLRITQGLWADLAGVPRRERAAATAKGEPASMSWTLTTPAPAEAIRDAFHSTRELSVPPLRDLVPIGQLTYRATVQYRGRHVDGHRGDVQKLFQRAIARLEAAGHKVKFEEVKP